MTQIQIPSELPNILRNFTLSVLRNRPSNIIDHAVDYFTRLQQEEHRTDSLKKNQSEHAVSSSGSWSLMLRYCSSMWLLRERKVFRRHFNICKRKRMKQQIIRLPSFWQFIYFLIKLVVSFLFLHYSFHSIRVFSIRAKKPIEEIRLIDRRFSFNTRQHQCFPFDDRHRLSTKTNHTMHRPSEKKEYRFELFPLGYVKFLSLSVFYFFVWSSSLMNSEKLSSRLAMRLSNLFPLSCDIDLVFWSILWDRSINHVRCDYV